MSGKKWLTWRTGPLLVVAIAAALCWLIVDQASATTGKRVKAANLKGLVTDSHGRPLVDAVVYLIDTATIDTTSPLGYAQVLDGSAEAYDEPLEDIVRNAEKAKALPQGKTNSKGQFSVKKLNAAATYYAFVQPGEKDLDHLPGGDASRVAFSPKSLGKTGLKIKMSWKTPSDATYIGTTACYVCHGAGSVADASNCKQHAHALMFRKMSGDTANQNAAGHVGSDFTDFASKFTLATDYNAPTAPATKVKTLYYQLDGTTTVCYEDAAGKSTSGATLTEQVRVYLWKDAAGNYKATLENKQFTEPVLTLDVLGTMGGYIRQRLVVRAPGMKTPFQFIGYQAIKGSASQGSDANYDRSRRKFTTGSPGGGGLSTFFNATTKRLVTAPPYTTSASGSTGAACAGCHIGGGPMRQQTAAEMNPVTKERLTSSTSDPNGVFDLDSDGDLDDIGITCEVCHGPGSKHREEALKAVTAPAEPTTTTRKKTAQPEDFGGKHIINPDFLGADRASVLCGRCHIGGSVKDHNNFAPPGISRAEYLATYVTEKGPGASSFYPDGKHMRGGHEGIAFDEWFESKHSRNTKRMLACHDCHDVMGNGAYRYGLKGDPDDSQNGLCNSCHEVEVTEHVPEVTGSPMSGSMMKCINCHMPRTGKGGAGRPGLFIGTPASASTSANANDANLVYWENDQSSHLWEVPTKFTPGVAGTQPGAAMPVPYTNSCAPCHDATKLQYQGPQ